MFKKYSLLLAFALLFSGSVMAEEAYDLLQVEITYQLEQNQKIMENIVLTDQKSECLNLRDCKTDVQSNDNIQSYFQDDIELALQDIL